MFQSKTLPEFWECYDELPEDIRRRAEKQFVLFAENPAHPSALAVREENVCTWFWIGPHDAYERKIK